MGVTASTVALSGLIQPNQRLATAQGDHTLSFIEFSGGWGDHLDCCGEKNLQKDILGMLALVVGSNRVNENK